MSKNFVSKKCPQCGAQLVVFPDGTGLCECCDEEFDLDDCDDDFFSHPHETVYGEADNMPESFWDSL